MTPASTGAPTDLDEDLPWLRQRFASWPSPLPELLNNAQPEDLLRHELHDLKPLRTLVSGRVGLVGDAAHAIAPNLGQGACLALEDAVELAAALDHDTTPDGDIAQQLRIYNDRRLPRVHRIAKRSRTAGTVAAVRGPTLATVRNVLVRAIPAAMSLRALDPIVDWRPPQS